jgi:hypothetical protein
MKEDTASDSETDFIVETTESQQIKKIYTPLRARKLTNFISSVESAEVCLLYIPDLHLFWMTHYVKKSQTHLHKNIIAFQSRMCVVTFRHLFDVQNSTAFLPEVNKIVRKHVCPKYNLYCITRPLARLSKCGGFLNTSFNTQNSQLHICNNG